MEIPNSKAFDQIQQLFQKPRAFIEEEFSPYFYRYYNRYSNANKFNGYLSLCKYVFRVTKAKDASVLDLGCGFGLMATIFGLYGSKEVIGYDLNVEKINLFKNLNPKIKNMKPVLGDSSRIDYSNGFFDVVITNETFSHIREMEQSIKEVYRVLKPGGRFLIRDGNNSLFLLGKIGKRKFWKRIERGPIDQSWFRSTDIPLPYIEIRRKMINEKFPQIGVEKIDFLSKETIGMFGEEIFKAVEDFEKNGTIPNKPKFCYRNPISGEYPEKEINPFSLRKLLEEVGFEVSFTPYFYSESFKCLEMAVKRFYYFVEKYLPIAHLLLSPGFALLGVKKKLG
jgi:SAM-dependent methyltransferase